MKLNIDESKLREQLEVVDRELISLQMRRAQLDEVKAKLVRVLSVVDPSWFKRRSIR